MQISGNKYHEIHRGTLHVKLCFIADGRSIHTQRWVEYFAQRGHEVHLITYDPMDRSIPGVTEYVLTSSLEKSLPFLHTPSYRNKKTRKKN